MAATVTIERMIYTPDGEPVMTLTVDGKPAVRVRLSADIWTREGVSEAAAAHLRPLVDAALDAAVRMMAETILEAARPDAAPS